MIHYIDGNQLTNEILKSKKLILVEFCISNSLLCQKQHEILRNIEKDFNEIIDVFKIDITEKSQDTKILYNISSFPTIIFFSNNSEIERKVGLQEYEDIASIINNL